MKLFLVRSALLCTYFLLSFAARGSEVQKHGLSFEHWIADTFFEGYRPSGMTQKWDIPADFNKRYGGVPVNPKATKMGTAVGMGDALRQFDIDETFLLIVGFWKQEEGGKRFVQALTVKITPEKWRELWGNVTREDIVALDRLVKDKKLTITEARKAALKIKSQQPFSDAVIQVNPKIDHAQRRLQCSIPYGRLFDVFAPDENRGELTQAKIFGEPIPRIAGSGERVFQKRN